MRSAGASSRSTSMDSNPRVHACFCEAALNACAQARPFHRPSPWSSFCADKFSLACAAILLASFVSCNDDLHDASLAGYGTHLHDVAETVRQPAHDGQTESNALLLAVDI